MAWPVLWLSPKCRMQLGMCEIDFFLFWLGFWKKLIWFGMSLVQFSWKKMRFGSDIIVIYYSCNSWVVNLWQILQRQQMTWLLLFTFYFSGGFHAVYIGKPSEQMSNFGWFGFLKPNPHWILVFRTSLDAVSEQTLSLCKISAKSIQQFWRRCIPKRQTDTHIQTADLISPITIFVVSGMQLWLRSKSRSDRLLQLTRLVGGANLDHKYCFE